MTFAPPPDHNASQPDLILASSSPYRRELLQRLGLSFSTRSPDVDESPHHNESVESYTRRLALSKAQAVAQRCPQAWVIGSDQAAALDQQILGKPGNAARAVQQLQACSGQCVRFITALCLITPEQPPHQASDETRVYFRTLEKAEIERYIAREQPLNCAGSFKAEGLGISLFQRIENDDPSALIGLPLIALSQLLRNAGMAVP